MSLNNITNWNIPEKGELVVLDAPNILLGYSNSEKNPSSKGLLYAIDYFEEEDIDDRLELLKSKCDSDLERDVLDRIHINGIPLPDEAQKVVFDGDTPIAKPDFYFRRQNLAIFIDGPDHDKDYVIQDDKRKRAKLKGLGYRDHIIYYRSISENIIAMKELGL